MMEGFDVDWQYLGKTHSATYTNLNAGTYTFRVKASNNDGLWNEAGTSIQVVVLPLVGHLVGNSALYVLARVVLGAFIQLQNKRNQDKAEASRLKLLNEAKSSFLSTVSHELRTPADIHYGLFKIIKNGWLNGLYPTSTWKTPK
ncbi:MAG: hypothetical protein IPJ40_03055 [Saprospirales bacterium]|nr:hypothetical protein [Saprospirales bacterium]